MLVEDIALSMTPGLGLKGAVRLLEVFSSAENIFRASREELIHFAELNPAIAEAVVGRVAFAQAQREVEYCRRNGITVLASTDAAYPPLLKMANDYPHVLYVVGDPWVLSRRNISMVGTRRVSPYGDRICFELVRDLSAIVPNLCIVSGLAFGVDSASHRAALDFKIPTVAVVANPLPAITPTQHSALAANIVESGGAIISEFHSQTKYHNSLYTSRNRIIAALSEVTIVVESPLSGGSMQTAAAAHGYDRTVMAVPGRITDANSAGCNMLIRNNIAQILLSAEQIVRTQMWDCDAPADRVVIEPLCVDLSEAQTALVKCFTSDDPMSIHELCELTDLPISELSVMLMELELQGVVRMLHGNRFELLRAVVTR